MKTWISIEMNLCLHCFALDETSTEDRKKYRAGALIKENLMTCDIHVTQVTDSHRLERAKRDQNGVEEGDEFVSDSTRVLGIIQAIVPEDVRYKIKV